VATRQFIFRVESELAETITLNEPTVEHPEWHFTDEQERILLSFGISYKRYGVNFSFKEFNAKEIK
jgi:hypothetical protein